MQHWIKTGLSSRRFGDLVLVWLTIASFVHFLGRIVDTASVTNWYVPVQLVWGRFYLILVVCIK